MHYAGNTPRNRPLAVAITARPGYVGKLAARVPFHSGRVAKAARPRFPEPTEVRMKRLLFATFLTGCAQSAGSSAPVPHETACVRVGDIYRCENDEVVCYGAGASGLQCKWKETK